MRLEIVNAVVLFHWPNFQCHIIGARGQQLSLRIPFDGIHFVRMSQERFQRLVGAHSAYVNSLIGAATGERGVRLPIDVQCWRNVEWELLCTLTSGRVPDDCGAIDTGRQNEISFFVPFQCENGSFVLAKCIGQTPICGPNASVSIVAASRKQRTIAIPIQRCDVFVAGHFSAALLNAMTQYQLIWTRRIVGHVPDACGAITGTTGQ